MPHVMTLFFEPLDVLVFRDHRPFFAGQHFLARSHLPLPSVFFGALRTALFERAGVRFGPFKVKGGNDPFATLSDEDRELLGDACQHGRMQLSGPLLARRPEKAKNRAKDKAKNGEIEPLLPWPRDLDFELRDNDSNSQPQSQPGDLDAYPVLPHVRTGRGFRLQAKAGEPTDSEPTDREFIRFDPKLPLPQRASDNKLGKPSKERLLLTIAGAKKYAEESAKGSSTFTLDLETDYVQQTSILEKERRTGISMARAAPELDADPRVVEESMLFTIETWRLAAGSGFAIDLALSDEDAANHGTRLRDLLRSLDGATLRLGGKAHHARVSLIETPLLDSLDTALKDLPQDPSAPLALKSWCLTPSLIDPAGSLRPTLTMVLGDTRRLGGFNFRASKDRPRGPRPLVSALEPGAILFFDDRQSNDSSALNQAIQGANETRGDPYGHLTCAGYGEHRLLPYRIPQ